jgi:hypothetical protein
LDKLNLQISKLFPRPFERIALKNHNLIGVEIGVWKGDHAFSLFKHANIKRLFLVDPYLNYEDYDSDDELTSKNSGKNLPKEEINAKTKLKAYNYKINWIKKCLLMLQKIFQIT